MKLDLSFKIFCGSCHIDMEDLEIQVGLHRIRCMNPDCEKPSIVYIKEG